MDYKGSYPVFDSSKVRTYPLSQRPNKVDLDGFINCSQLRQQPVVRESAELEEFAAAIKKLRSEGKPVICLTGAHPIKNGLAPLIIDLMQRKIITLYGTNGASTIHSFELALTGSSSENVPKVLPAGDFGMAFETGVYLNQALIEGAGKGWGYGECMGRLIADADFRKTVIDRVFEVFPDSGDYLKPYDGFPHADINIFARAYELGIPATVHGMIGTDITDQHANFDGAAKGLASGRDFLVFTQEVCRCSEGGAVLNIGTAVMGPEVLLKAVSMAANTGRKPDRLITADFDIRPAGNTSDESKFTYYFRDQKSIVTRIPGSFGGKGYYFEGNHSETVTSLYQYLVKG